ncbi:hypothetical protein EDB83DRAFT_2396906 [Lactarius deliciosus]|nr:hypothetical protein EDB83DRAFT_2396906 [Lactarius deliciosus]
MFDHIARPDNNFTMRNDSYIDIVTGIVHVYLCQTVNGLDVADGGINVSVTSDGLRRHPQERLGAHHYWTSCRARKTRYQPTACPCSKNNTLPPILPCGDNPDGALGYYMWLIYLRTASMFVLLTRIPRGVLASPRMTLPTRLRW